MPRNNFFFVFLPRKSKILSRIKMCPISLKFYDKTQNLPSRRAPPLTVLRPLSQLFAFEFFLNTSVILLTNL